MVGVSGAEAIGMVGYGCHFTYFAPPYLLMALELRDMSESLVGFKPLDRSYSLVFSKACLNEANACGVAICVDSVLAVRSQNSWGNKNSIQTIDTSVKLSIMMKPNCNLLKRSFIS